MADYTVNVKCTNCYWTGSKTIRKGTRVIYESCPNCGVQDLEVVVPKDPPKDSAKDQPKTSDKGKK